MDDEGEVVAAVARAAGRVPVHDGRVREEERVCGHDERAALGLAAEHVEEAARDAVEARTFPDEIIDYSATLRPLFEEALAALRSAAVPVISARPLRRAGGFGRKVG